MMFAKKDVDVLKSEGQRINETAYKLGRMTAIIDIENTISQMMERQISAKAISLAISILYGSELMSTGEELCNGN